MKGEKSPASPTSDYSGSHDSPAISRAQAGRGGEGQQYGLGDMTTAKPRPPLAPGETRAYPVLPL
ncbi:MAG: hypothetical protein WAN75_52210, partial [Xanthobacteraceae bacterium]